MGFATTMYCDKCGKIWIIFHPYTHNSMLCDMCKNTIKAVPDKYFENLSNEGLLLSKDMEQQLINDLVLTSPNFDQYYFDNKNEIKEQQDREYDAKMEYGKSILEEKSRVPKCPTCNSANIEKISTGKKVLGGAMFGLLSSDVRNTMHCKNCGYKW